MKEEMSILLAIDSSVRDSNLIAGAVKPDVTILTYNRFEDTFVSILDKVRLLNKSFSTMGFLYHSDPNSPYYIPLVKEKPFDVYDSKKSDPELSKWSDLITFYTELKSITGVSIIDFITCSLKKSMGWGYVLPKLEEKTGINFRSSTNYTGNPSVGGDWIQETDEVDIKPIYFTDEISKYTGLLYFAYVFNSGQECTKNSKVSRPMISSSIPVDPTRFRPFSPNAKVKAFGYGPWGGHTDAVDADLSGGVIAIVSTYRAFAALKTNGTVVTWGDPLWGGDSSVVASQLTNVKYIASTNAAFAAIKQDGSVVVWGSIYMNSAQPEYGNVVDATSFTASTVGNNLLGGVVAIATGRDMFAALKLDGTVVTWGAYIGDAPKFISPTMDLNSYETITYAPHRALVNIKSIAAGEMAFSAIDTSGNVITWGHYYNGGDSTPVRSQLDTENITHVVGNSIGFTALKSDGSIVKWGPAVGSPPVSTGYVAIAANLANFCGIREDGSVYAWGYGTDIGFQQAGNYTNSGGNPSMVASQLSSGVKAIIANPFVFAAIKENGTIVSWGWDQYGGDATNDYPEYYAPRPDISGVITISSTTPTVIAIDSSRNAYCWGNKAYGASSDGPVATNVNEVACLDLLAIYRKRDGTTFLTGYQGFMTNADLATIPGTVVSVATGWSAVAFGYVNYAANQTAVLTKVNSGNVEDLKSYLKDSTSGSVGDVVTLYGADVTPLIGQLAPNLDFSKFLSAQINFVKVINNELSLNTNNLTNNSIVYYPIDPIDGVVSATVDSKTYNLSTDGNELTVLDVSNNIIQKVQKGKYYILGNRQFLYSFAGSAGTEDGSLATSTTATLQFDASVSGTAVISVDGVVTDTVTIDGTNSSLTVIDGLSSTATSDVSITFTDSTTSTVQTTSFPVKATNNPLAKTSGKIVIDPVSSSYTNNTATIVVENTGTPIIPVTLTTLTALGNHIFFNVVSSVSGSLSFFNYVGKQRIPLTANIASLTSGQSYNVTVSDLSANTVYNIVAIVTDSNSKEFYSAVNMVQTTSGGGVVPCFFPNAPVLTPTGYKRISSLRVGDKVMSEGKAVEIEKVSYYKIEANVYVNPYCIPVGKYGATKKLLISPDHKVLVNGNLVKAKHLGLEQVVMEGEIEYYNLQIKGQGTMNVAGVTVESLVPTEIVTLTQVEYVKLLCSIFGTDFLSNPEVLKQIRRRTNRLKDGKLQFLMAKK